MSESQLQTLRYIGSAVSGSFISVPHTVLRAVLTSAEMRDFSFHVSNLKIETFRKDSHVPCRSSVAHCNLSTSIFFFLMIFKV